ncbi:MAG: Ger(x)C family spore germination protein [Bacillota bacterium]
MAFLGACMSGCYGRHELEELSFVTILGVDKGRDKHLLATASIALPRKMLGGSPSEGGGTSTSFIISVECEGLLDGLAQMTTMTSRRVTTAHTQIVILGEDLARDDAGVILDVFSRNLEFRQNTLVAVCKGSASQFIRNFSVPEESEPSDYLVKLIHSCKLELGICPFTSIYDFLIAYGTEQTEPWTPYLTLASPVESVAETPEGEGKSNGSDGSSQGEGPEDAGDPPERIIELAGSAVFKKHGGKMRMVGTLDTKETMAVSILMGDFSRGFMDIIMPRTPERRGTLVFQHCSVIRKTSIEDDRVRVTFRIRATASMEETTSREMQLSPGYHAEIVDEAQRTLESLLQGAFIKLTAMESDILGLGRTIHGHFRTWPELKQFDWPSKFKYTVADYDLKLFVLTSGYADSPPTPE